MPHAIDGFLGTRATFMLDVVTLAMLLVLPVLELRPVSPVPGIRAVMRTGLVWLRRGLGRFCNCRKALRFLRNCLFRGNFRGYFRGSSFIFLLGCFTGKRPPASFLECCFLRIFVYHTYILPFCASNNKPVQHVSVCGAFLFLLLQQ